MGSFERFKTKTHFNSLKRLVGVTRWPPWP